MKPETIKIDDVEYVRADSQPKLNTEGYSIVRSGQAGVFAGIVTESNLKEQWAKMKDARRIWYWSGAASLSQLAVDGVNDPKNCKFSMPTPEQTILGVCEIIPCSLSAIKNIAGVPVWKR